MNVDIAYRLSRLRRDRGYSQEKLAEKLGVSRQAVSKWERAESSPDTDNLIALADIYGMSLDELLKGSPEQTAADENTSPANGSSGKMAATAAPATTRTESDTTPASPEAAATCGSEGQEYIRDNGARVPSASPTSSDEAADSSPSDRTDDATGTGTDRVSINWRDGINVHDKHGAEVHVGWNGIHVDDPNEDAHVHIGGDGMDIHDGSGHEIHSDPSGGFIVDGIHYDSWKEAHRASEHHGHHRIWMSRFPYALVALVAFLCMGIFAYMWTEGLLVLFSSGLWWGITSVVEAFSQKKPARKRRSSVTSLIGIVFLYAFFMVGFMLDAWHPGWILILAGFLLCTIVKAVWRVDGKDTETT